MPLKYDPSKNKQRLWQPHPMQRQCQKLLRPSRVVTNGPFKAFEPQALHLSGFAQNRWSPASAEDSSLEASSQGNWRSTVRRVAFHCLSSVPVYALCAAFLSAFLEWDLASLCFGSMPLLAEVNFFTWLCNALIRAAPGKLHRSRRWVADPQHVHLCTCSRCARVAGAGRFM